MNITAIPVVPLKLSQEAHYFAKKFAAEQATALKAKGVYLNTLAVCAVYSWVQWMEFTTEIGQGESWDPVIRRFNDVADLVLTDIGRLECRPLLPGERSILVPLEVTEDRIGCVLVQFEEQLDKVKLLGFVPADASGNLPETISIEDLQSVEELTEYLEELDAPIFKAKLSLVNLSKWLLKDFDEALRAGWRKVKELLDVEESQLVPVTRFSTRGVPKNPVSRCKQIDLGGQAASQTVVLVVMVWKEDAQHRGIRLQVRPSKGKMRLPVNLRFALLDESGKIQADTAGKLLELTAGSNEPRFNLWFPGEPGECFGVRIALGDASVTEKFAI